MQQQLTQLAGRFALLSILVISLIGCSGSETAEESKLQPANVEKTEPGNVNEGGVREGANERSGGK